MGLYAQKHKPRNLGLSRNGGMSLQVNKRLMEQKLEKAQQEKHMEQEANQADMYNTFNSQLLTEHPATGINAFNSNRRRPDHFKGMLPEEKQRIIDHQVRPATLCSPRLPHTPSPAYNCAERQPS